MYYISFINVRFFDIVKGRYMGIEFYRSFVMVRFVSGVLCVEFCLIFIIVYSMFKEG